ncbi:hypothetical protein [Brevibacillus sp. H7]|uniref:hypothetical protein n=1 Tax=Brevibacillus sp. H7 TaxID=3349138 RepID=UPI00382CC3E7
MNLGNFSSTLAQLANIPVGAAFAKEHSIKGIGLTLKSLMPGMENQAMKQSGFMNERYVRKLYRQFDTKLIEQPKRLAEWMMETTERIGTEFVWNSANAKGLAEGVKNPVKYADDETRRLIAGRGIGEVPLAQKSKMVQLFMPFTLEVASLWKVQKDFIKAKDFGGLVGLYLGAYLLNKGMEATRGSGILFDPIDAIADAATAESLSSVQRAGILAGEVLINLPAGPMIANQLYPEYGKTIDIPGVGKAELPTRQELFGNNDPTRFGSGLTLSKGM